MKALPITIHEIALYRDYGNNSAPSQSSHLWNLLTSARDFLLLVLEWPNDIVTDLPSAFFNLFPYALVVLSIVSRFPSTSGWDSSIARQEADFINICQRVRAKFGTDISKTPSDVDMEKKDVWQFFSRGLGGLLAWHQKCGSTPAGEVEVDVSIVSPYLTMKCAMADTMTAFASMRIRKSSQPNCGAENETQPVVQLYGAANAETDIAPSSTTISTDAQLPQQDLSGSFGGDDMVWQSIIDDFSMFPTTTGFAAVPPGFY